MTARYVWQYFVSDDFHAGPKAQNDVTSILVEQGWEPFRTRLQGSSIGKARTLASYLWRLMRLRSNSIFIIQLPLYAWWDVLLMKLILRRFRVIAIVYDINELRGDPLGTRTDVLRSAAAVITPSARMAAWLGQKFPGKPIFSLDVFDYRCNPGTERLHGPGTGVIFAGNLNPKKAGFLYGSSPALPSLDLYGVNPDVPRLAPGHRYLGTFEPDSPKFPEGASMGLIWDGTSADGCSGQAGEYYRYITPHKTALYLACGLPIIASKEAGIADLVEREQCGFCVDRLADIPARLKTFDEASIAAMNANARRLGERIRSGYYTTKAVSAALSAIATTVH